MPTIDSFDGLQIAFDDVGSGPAVMLLHGYTGRGAHWAELGVVDALTRARFRVITIDLRGHGDSAAPHDFAAYENEALARDVVALADARSLERYALVGYSLGSIVAGTVARRDPRVKALVLGGLGDAVFDVAWDRPALLKAALTGDDRARVAEPMANLVLELVATGGGDVVALAGVQHGHVALPPDVLAKIDVPTLVVCGRDDLVNGRPGPLARALPNAQLLEIDGDHVGAFGTEEFTWAVVAFLEGVRQNNVWH